MIYYTEFYCSYTESEILKNKLLKQPELILRYPRTYMWLVSKPVRYKKRIKFTSNCSKQYFPCRIFKFFPPEHPIRPSLEPKHGYMACLPWI